MRIFRNGNRVLFLAVLHLAACSGTCSGEKGKDAKPSAPSGAPSSATDSPAKAERPEEENPHDTNPIEQQKRLERAAMFEAKLAATSPGGSSPEEVARAVMTAVSEGQEALIAQYVVSAADIDALFTSEARAKQKRQAAHVLLRAADTIAEKKKLRFISFTAGSTKKVGAGEEGFAVPSTLMDGATVELEVDGKREKRVPMSRLVEVKGRWKVLATP